VRNVAVTSRTPVRESVAEAVDEHDRRLIAEVARFVPQALEVTNTPGLNIALARRGQVIWEAGFGLADIAHRRPMAPSTLTRGASMSKLYTCIAVLQLVERGVIGLYDPLVSYLPKLPLANPLGEREVTLYDLITFRSGLAPDTTDCYLTPPPRLAEFLHSTLRRPTLREYGGTIPRWTAKVGERHQYSNLGIACLGSLVEQTNPERLPFTEYVRRHIIDALDLRSTWFPPVQAPPHLPADVLAQVSTGYAGFGQVTLPSPIFYQGSYPSCTLLTTPGDQVRLLSALLHPTGPRRTAILAPETVQHMLTPQTAISDPDVPADWFAGLGVVMGKVDQTQFHFGYEGSHVWGWWNASRAYPVLDLCAAVFTNKWEMLQWHNPALEGAADLVVEFVAITAQQLEQTRRSRTKRSWPWKLSYVMGLLLAERTRGFLGVSGFPRSDDLDAIISTVRSQAPVSWQTTHWDEAGLRAGADDFSRADPTREGVQRFLASPECQVSLAELPLINRALGGVGQFPAPLDFWYGRPAAPVNQSR